MSAQTNSGDAYAPAVCSALRFLRLLSAPLGFLLLAAEATPVGAAVCDGVHRVANTTLKSVVVVSGLTSRPLFVTAPAGDVNRLFIVGQNGLIEIHKRGDGPAVVSTFLNITTKVNASSCDECGLLGLAFDPQYATNRYFYVNYTEQVSGQVYSVVARYTANAANPDLADPASELRLIRVVQPENNHNGGWLAFGADNYLYIATGDGGGANDQHDVCGYGQATTTLLGKILRIDPANLPGNRAADCGGTTNYRIPVNNPLVGSPISNCEEIFAWGLRNPWRPTIDPATGDWYIADVGQNCWEEVNYATGASAAGRNYGWREMEGAHCFNPLQSSNCSNATPSTGCPKTCNDPSFTPPVLEYSHAEGCSITGGFVYRGCQMSALQGRYFYGDYCDGFVRSFRIAGGLPTQQTDWSTQIDPNGDLIAGLTSFGTDGQGELYVTDRDGEVRRIMPPFTDLEVSGDGVGNAQQFLLGKPNWTWEDLAYSTMHPVAQYRIYRSTTLNGTYSCIFRTTGTSWAGGDTTRPAVGGLLHYLVVAVSPENQLSRPRGGAVTTLSPTPCP